MTTLADILEQERRKKHPEQNKITDHPKVGQRPAIQDKAKQNLLQSTQGWEMKVHLGRKLLFPEVGLSTTLRPNIVMWSLEGKKVILVELTVPWEENCE